MKNRNFYIINPFIYENMDIIDKKIICELDENCRVPISLLARNLKISRNIAGYRIKRLEDEGIITKYICSMNIGLLGFRAYKVYWKVRPQIRDEELFVDELMQNRKVIRVLKMEGSFDYATVFACDHLRELDDFLMTTKTHFSQLISDYQVGIVAYTNVFSLRKLFLDEARAREKQASFSGGHTKLVLDGKDKAILHVVAEEARISVVEIAKKTGLSVDVVLYRLRHLEKSIIHTYRALFDFSKLGYFHYVFLLQIRSATKADETRLVEWCRNYRSVLFCTKKIAQFDFEINAAIASIEELNGFIFDLKREFGHIIDNYETLVISDVMKLQYAPF